MSAAVTGVGVVSAAGGIEATRAALRAGARAAPLLPAPSAALGVALRGHAIAPVDAAALGVEVGRLRYLAPAACHLQRAMCEALDRAGLRNDVARLAGFGIAIGARVGERASAAEAAVLGDPMADADAPTCHAARLLAQPPLTALRAQPGLLAATVAELHGIGGPCVTVIDESAAGGLALGLACEAISDGWGPQWVAGGTVDCDDPWTLLARPSEAPPCGSAAAVLVLEAPARAAARGATVLAELACVTVPAPESWLPGGVCGGALDGVVVADALGDTLAAAIPLALALAVHAGACAPAGGGARVMGATPGIALEVRPVRRRCGVRC